MLIPFIPNKNSNKTQEWLMALRKVMPDHQIMLLQELSDAEREKVELAIIANVEDFDFSTLPNLKWVHSTWAGIENTLHNPSLEKIPLVRMQDPTLAQTMAQSVFLWVMNCQQHVPVYRQQQQTQTWRPHAVKPNKDINILILGAGNMGSAAGRLLAQNNYKVACWKRTHTQGDKAGLEIVYGIDELRSQLPLADIIVCLLPLTAQTRRLLDKEMLSLIQPTSYLLNFGRGDIVDEQALLECLNKQTIKHAILDVFSIEPLPISHPFWHHSAITVLPHVTAPTNPATASKVIANNIATYLVDGSLPEAVDRKRGY